MSVVISFRLNPDNPREAQALKILQTKQAEGFSSRRRLTDALISVLDDHDFNETLEHVSDLLERLNGNNQECSQIPRQQSTSLNDHFLNSVKMAAKPGLRSKA